jgi:hypothetical protein
MRHHSKPPADWRQVFSRSSLGRNALFVRGTHRSHAGFNSYKTRYEHPRFRDILEIGDRYGLVRTSHHTGSPANASTYEDYAAFLDGGLMSKAGDYLIGLHGARVIGHAAVRFVRFELGVTPPRWPVAAESASTHADLVRRILVQLATELPILRQRLREFQHR